MQSLIYAQDTMENVWEYPRPPAVRPSELVVRIELAAHRLARSERAVRVLETSHPPTIYVPRDDIEMSLLTDSARGTTFCEFKGHARYVDAVIEGRRFEEVGWFYPDPTPGYESLRDHIAFYPGRVDGAWLGDERVQSQVGSFYGGWITSDLVGPFKGAPGTLGW